MTEAGAFFHPEPDLDLRFKCSYGVSWPLLLPQVARSQLVVPVAQRAGFRLNPRLHCQRDVPDPQAWQARMAKIGYSEDSPVCWVEHPLFGYPEAYWPEADMLALIDELAAGKPVESLNEECFELLSAGHLLVLEESIYAEQMHALRHHWRQRLAHEQYLHIPNLISPLQVAALRAYTRRRRQAGPLQYEDDQYTRRYYRVYDPVLNFLHQHLLQVLGSLVPDQLRTSYNVISYYTDTELIPHVDREPCIWNISVQLDSQPAACEGAPWPLYLHTHHGDTPVMLTAGDALIYKGREMTHWRDKLPAGREETVLLFHFVDQDYQGELY